MSRTLTFLAIVAVALLVAPFAYASGSHDSYDYDYNYSDVDYRSYDYDGSIDHSFNTYDSYNYTYGYPYQSGYAYREYDYSGNYYYNHDSNQYAYNRDPECTISAYDTNGAYNGGGVTITWTSSYARSANLSGVGSVYTSGSQTFYSPLQSYYTLTVYGPGGSTSCSVSNPRTSQYFGGHYPGYTYTNTYAYPLHTYSAYSYPSAGYVYPTQVQLNQIPYTGFDFGSVGNALYWLAMIFVAAAGAYLIVYSQSGVYPRAFAREVASAARNQMRFVKSLVK